MHAIGVTWPRPNGLPSRMTRPCIVDENDALDRIPVAFDVYIHARITRLVIQTFGYLRVLLVTTHPSSRSDMVTQITDLSERQETGNCPESLIRILRIFKRIESPSTNERGQRNRDVWATCQDRPVTQVGIGRAHGTGTCRPDWSACGCAARPRRGNRAPTGLLKAEALRLLNLLLLDLFSSLAVPTRLKALDL